MLRLCCTFSDILTWSSAVGLGVALQPCSILFKKMLSSPKSSSSRAYGWFLLPNSRSFAFYSSGLDILRLRRIAGTLAEALLSATLLPSFCFDLPTSSYRCEVCLTLYTRQLRFYSYPCTSLPLS